MRSPIPGVLFALMGVVVLVAADLAPAALTLVDAGEARAHVVIADPAERTAADEIVGHIERITGVELAIHTINDAPANGIAIRLGAAAGDDAHALARDTSDDPATFALIVDDSAVHIAGLSPQATLYGTYELLEQLGVRWFMPGELGTVLPDTDTLSLATQRTAQSPSFTARNVSALGGTWSRRMRLGGTSAPSSLSMPNVGDFDEHPERYALVNGERHRGQLCVSNPDTIAAAAATVRRHFDAQPDARWYAMGNHGERHCQCADCRALDPEAHCGPYTGGVNVSDRYLWFVDQLFDTLGDELPSDKRIALTVATPHMCAPVNQTGHPRLDIVAWAIGHCRIHGVNNPVCPERTMVYHRIADWVERLDGDYYERGDWGNVAGPGFLYASVHKYRRDIPDYHAINVAGYRTAAYAHWISEQPSIYIAAKLLWDHEADVDALLDDFYTRYYGPAAAPMRQYHERLDAAARDADHHTGTAIDVPHIYHAGVRSAARDDLNAALAAARDANDAEDNIYYRRVEAVTLALDYTDVFVEMLEHRNRHDYAAAFAALERARSLIDRLLNDYDPPLLRNSYAHRFLDHFFGRGVEQAHHFTSTGGEFVTGLDDQWDFRIDPEGLGESKGWWRADLTGGNWQRIRTHSSSWRNEGLGYYQGQVWYRQRVQISEAFEGRNVMLWIGGVDEQATAWVNGVNIGEGPARAFRPVEFDATEAVRFGQQNVVVIRVRNEQMLEVGTGGIVAPVMFYTPADDS